MPVPTQNRFYRPILTYLADGKFRTIAQVREELKKKFRLDDKDLKIMIPSGDKSVFENRFSWARTDLRQAGLIKNPFVGSLQITDKGTRALRGKQKITKRSILKGNRSPKTESKAESELQHLEKAETKSPDDKIEEIRIQAESDLPQELLRRLRENDPTFFEKAVIKLIEVLYESSKPSLHTGGPGDGGIDGIVQTDPLGFNAIYIQAKRYKEGNLVGEGELQKFAGVLSSKNASQGVFITSSEFHPNTIKFSEHLKNIKLIDGKELAFLMIEYEVGVITNHYQIKQINDNFFSSSE